jgi:hypothetical protein
MIEPLPIVGYYDLQRVAQFNPSDCANWYLVNSSLGKKKTAMFPVMGRKKVRFLNQNRLKFSSEPRKIFESINYWYAVVNDTIIRIDQFYNTVEITASTKLSTIQGKVFFTYLVAGSITFACFTDGQKIYVYREDTGSFTVVTDSNAPSHPWAIAAFGNRLAVSEQNSSEYVLSEIDLEGSSYDPSTCFTISGNKVFAQEEGVIRQMGVLQNTLYIFNDFSTGVWSNIPSTIPGTGGTGETFPWKKNTTFSFNYGIADESTLDIDFGRMCWLGKNKNGIPVPLMSTGGKPEELSSSALNVLLQSILNVESDNPFISLMADGFLYEYEDTVFYRISSGSYDDTQLLDQITTSFSMEYNFDTETWHRCIELNGQPNRIRDHIFFGNKHYVTVKGDSTVYEMSGKFFTNDITNPDQPDSQASDAYISDPFRYLRVTPIICSGTVESLSKNNNDYNSEFITDWVQIDFVWGLGTFHFTSNDVTPTLNSSQYHNWFKPHIELLFSNDGGVSYQTAGNLEFSELGQYQWRMRWYELGASRNRVYKLICVSSAPIYVLGGSMEVRRASGGAA